MQNFQRKYIFQWKKRVSRTSLWTKTNCNWKQWLRVKRQRWLTVPRQLSAKKRFLALSQNPLLPRGIVRLHAFSAKLTYKQTASVVINRNHRRQTHIARIPVGYHWLSWQDVRIVKSAYAISDQYLWPKIQGWVPVYKATLRKIQESIFIDDWRE